MYVYLVKLLVGGSRLGRERKKPTEEKGVMVVINVKRKRTRRKSESKCGGGVTSSPTPKRP